MATEFKLPEVTDGVTEVDVGEIYVSVGDSVNSGDLLMQVETEKAGADIEADFSGTISSINVKTGESIPIGHVLLSYGEGGEADSSGGGDEEKPAESTESKSEPKEESAAVANSGTGTDANATKYPGGDDKHTSTADQNESSRPDLSREIPPPAAPNVRRVARERGIDLRSVSGSANAGRITIADLDGARAGGAMTSTAGGQMASWDGLPAPGGFEKFGEISRDRMGKLARTAAQNLSLSWQMVPHVTQHDLVDITDLEAARKRFVKGVGANGPKVTMTALMTKAIVTVLREFPKFNSSYDHTSDEIIYKNYHHIGIAVDTENGLVVPVIRDADQKSILEIASDLTDIAVRARDRKLSMNDMQGGTFTITNLGGIGGTSFTPIVNYPEVAILGMSRSQKVLELDDSGNVVQRLQLPLSLSYDHRVINGADAARFMKRLGGLLTDPMQLMVEV